MAWWDDLLSDLSGWVSKAQESVLGWTDEVGKGLAWIGQGIAAIGRAIWDALSFFAQLLWDALLNSAHAIRSGLSDIGNGIWWAFQKLGEFLKLAFDSLKSGLDWVGNKLYDFGHWVWAGISWIGSQLYNFGAWIWDGIAWVGETVWDGLKWVGGNLWAGIKGFGQWIWSGLTWLGAQVSKIAKWIWTSITNFFGVIYTTLKNWIGGLTTSMNAWTSGMLSDFRDKIDDILFANMMILGSRKIIENLTEKSGDAQSFGDIGFHILGTIGSAVALPIVGLITKEVLAGTVKKMGGSSIKLFPEESGDLKYLPEYTYEPEDIVLVDREAYREETPMFDSAYTPDITHSKPDVGTPPTPPSAVGTPFTPPTTPEVTEPSYYTPTPEAPSAPALGYGLPYDRKIEVKAVYDKTITSTDKSITITTAVEYEVT